MNDDITTRLLIGCCLVAVMFLALAKGCHAIDADVAKYTACIQGTKDVEKCAKAFP